MLKKIIIITGKKFQKELKKLLKKYNSLEEDLEKAIFLIKENPTGNGSKHWNVLKKNKEKYIVKTRMMCRSVRGSQFRIVYYYDGEKIELEFIEIYFKGNKGTEDLKRIEEIWKEKIQDFMSR